MTISSTTIKNSYAGNGSTTAFTFSYYIISEDDLEVLIRSSNGTETLQTLTTNYTVTGVQNNSGGTVTMVTAPATGETLVIRRKTSQVQDTDYVANDPFPAETHEAALDKAMLVSQELQEQVDRSIKISRTNTMTSTDFTVGASERANKVLAFDSTGEISVTQELGRYRGDWSASTAYAVRDLVKDTSTDNIFFCNTAHTSSGVEPLTTNSDSAKWDLIVDAAAATSSANAAASSATAAAASATDAASSATDAQTAQTAAELAETNAETAESNAATSEANAAASETAAATSETNAATSASNASTSESNASTSATNAASSATSASNSASTATTKASEASTSASNASTSATSAASSASSASSSASTATTKASEASTSATNAATSETNASNSATAAATSASNAATSESNASTSETNAASSASAAASSATAAANSASAASTSETNAATSESNASTSETNAATSASNASTSETNAATSATNASNAQTAAETAQAAAEAALDSFDDTYLGAKASDPSVDNDGDALTAGDTYYDTTNSVMKVYNGSSWDAIQTGVTDVAPTRHSIRPSLNLDFANSKTLDPRITFTRASSGVYYDGYSSVKAEENLITYSQNFSTSWTKASVTVTDNSVTAPDGTTTGAELEATSNTSSMAVYKTISYSTGDTVSVFAKEGTTEFFALQTGTSSPNALFNLNTGTVLSSGNCTATITSVGNGWYRCALENVTPVGAGYILMSPVGSDIGTGDAWGNNDALAGDNVYIWGVQLEKRTTATAYTPTTSQPITKYQPQLQTAQSNVARFDHNPTTGESLGLLIEESRTNLNTYSEQFSGGTWLTDDASIKDDQAISPDGTLTASKLVADATSSGTHRMKIGINVSSGSAYTVSLYAKAGEYSGISIHSFSQVIPSAGITADLITGNIFARANLTDNLGDFEMNEVGNGWYRINYTFTATSTGASTIAVTVFENITDSNISTYAGNDYSGIYVWGFQVEAGSFPTSYIKTTGSQVTRSSDIASMTGTNFSDWYRQDEGTLFADVRTNGGSPRVVFSNANSGYDNYRSFYVSGTQIRGVEKHNGATSVDTFYLNGSSNIFKFAYAYKQDDFAYTRDGNNPSTDTSGTPALNVDRMGIGLDYGQSATKVDTGIFKKLSYYPIRLTNNEIQDLSEA